MRTPLAAAAALTAAALPQQVPAQRAAAVDDVVVARAIDRTPSAQAVAFVAANAQAIRLDPARQPQAANSTVREIATSQCGSVQDGYIEAVQRLNPGVTIAAYTRPGAAAYSIKWPACLYVAESARIPYRIKARDTLTDIKRLFTGSGVFSKPDLASFFDKSGVSLAQARTLPEGKVITLPRATASTVLIPQGVDATAFAAQVTALTGGSVAADAESAGEIIGPVRFRDPGAVGSIQGTFAPCSGGETAGYPLDAPQIDAAYRWTRDQITGSVDRVTVVIVDNGFFGAPCGPGGCPPIVNNQAADSPRFPRKLFDTLQFDPRTGFGPTLTGSVVNPLNYWNRKGDGRYFTPADVNADTGHGTHVAGLALGGPAFLQFRSDLDGATGKSWLTLVIANLANGRSTLLPGSDRDLGSMLGQIDGAKIVNMSVTFTAKPNSTIGDTIKKAITGDGTSLFVVAAGNDGGSLESDDLDLYPANLGGTQANVITVASVDLAPDGTRRISEFSNRSAKYVDIAAPGCRVRSWLSAEGEPQEVSGTSQATPIVTFGASLLSSVWSVPPGKIKNRLLYSGDLLPALADRAAVRSGAVVNIAKALTFTLDRLTFLQNGSVRTVLGTATSLPAVACTAGAVAPENLKSLKRAPDGTTLVFRTRASGELDICPAKPVTGTLQFKPLRESTGAAMDSATTGDITVAADDIVDLVRAR